LTIHGHYSFNNQNSYVLARPITMPKINNVYITKDDVDIIIEKDVNKESS